MQNGLGLWHRQGVAMRIFGTILAGGAGRRMGADKALMRLHGQSLIAHAIARLGTAGRTAGDFGQWRPRPVCTALACPFCPTTPRLARLQACLPHCIGPPPWGPRPWSPSPSIRPFFPGDLTPRLCLAAETSPEGLALPYAAKDHPTCGLWPVALATPLAAFLASGAKAPHDGFHHRPSRRPRAFPR